MGSVVIRVGGPNKIVKVAAVHAHDRAQHPGERIVGRVALDNHASGAQRDGVLFRKLVPSLVWK
jgi:hypothetical protein